MASPLIEKINVTYRTSNGKKNTCRIVDIPEKDRDSIVSLAILPIYNKDGSESRQRRDLKDIIVDFPILSTLYYPSQLGVVSADIIRVNGCPNLSKIISTHNAGSALDYAPLTIRTKGDISTSSPTKRDITTFGNLVEEKKVGPSIVEVYKLSSGTASVAPQPTKPRTMTSADIAVAMKTIAQKLGVIASRADHPEQVLTAEQFESILQKYVGRISIAGLEDIVSAIKNINVNVDSAHLADAVRHVVSERIDTLVNNQAEQDKTLEEIVKSIETIRRRNGQDAEVYALLSKTLPELIGGNSKITNNINIETSIAGRDANDPSITLAQIGASLQDLGNKFNAVMTAQGLSAESHEYINKILTSFAQNYIGGNGEFIGAIQRQIANIPTAEAVRSIVRDEMKKYDSANPTVVKALEEAVTNSVVKAIGGFQDIGTKADLDNAVDKIISKMMHKSDVVEAIEKTINSSEFRGAEFKTASLDKISEQLTKYHEDVLALFYKEAEASSQFVTVKDVLEIIKANKDDKIDKKYLEDLVKCINDLGMTKEQTKQFLCSPFGAKVIVKAINISGVTDDLKKAEQAGIANNITITTGSTSESEAKISDMSKTFEEYMKSATQGYAYMAGLANGMTMAIGSNAMAMGMQAGISNPFAFANQSMNNFNPIVAQLALITNFYNEYLKKIGQQPTEIDTSKEIIEKFTKENEELKKRDEELQNQISELTKAVSDLKKSIEDMKKQGEGQEKGEGEDDTKKKKEEDDKKKKEEDDKKKIVKENRKEIGEYEEVKDLPIPEIQSKAFVKQSIKFAEKLKEPKMSRGKRFLNWVKRHPLALTAIGLGAGALLATGIGAVTGLVGVKLLSGNTLLQWMSLKLPKIGVGALAGLGVGGLAEVGTAIARKFGMGRKQRLYRKFQKGYEQCEDMREDIEKNAAEIEATRERLEQTREKQRTKKGILKKLGIYKMARSFQRKKLRILKAKGRDQEKSYKSHVEETLQYKKELNELEEKSGKTLAMGGYLQKLNKAKAKRDKKITNAKDKDQIEDFEDDYKEKVKDLKSDSGVEGLDQIKPSHRTFDAEAEELISTIKGEKSETMKEIEQNIKDRTAIKGEPEVEVVAEPKDAEKWQKFVTKVNDLSARHVAGVEGANKVIDWISGEVDAKARLKEAGYKPVDENPSDTIKKLIEEAQKKKRAEYEDLLKKDKKPAEPKEVKIEKLSEEQEQINDDLNAKVDQVIKQTEGMGKE